MKKKKKKDYVSPEMIELELYHQGCLLNASEEGEDPEESGPIDLG